VTKVLNKWLIPKFLFLNENFKRQYTDKSYVFGSEWYKEYLYAIADVFCREK